MREVDPLKLWLGNARDARSPRALHDVGVETVVDLAIEEPVAQLTRDLIYCRIPIHDGAENAPRSLAIAIEITASLIRREIPTLVACSAGMSRSPSIIAAALSLVRQRAPDEMLKEIIDGNPNDVSPALWADVKKSLSLICH
jgi:protein-tyrosine phosphatase